MIGHYPITTITNLPPDTTNGFGFFVLGDAALPDTDTAFTNGGNGTINLTDFGAAKLFRSMGALEHAVAWGAGGISLTNLGFTYIGEDGFAATPLYLAGTGNGQSEFNWTKDEINTDPLHPTLYTPGGGNLAQTITTNSPTIAASTNMVVASTQFGEDAPTQDIEVWNTGFYTLDYTLSEEASWLFIGPASGSSTGVSDKVTHTLTFDTSGLATGFYATAITVIDPTADNSPYEILVSLTVSMSVPPTNVTILDAWYDQTNIWLITTGTNDWYPHPWYTTNLMDTNAWLIVPSYNSVYTTGTHTIWFPPVTTNSDTIFYRAETTDSP